MAVLKIVTPAERREKPKRAERREAVTLGFIP